MQGSETSGGRGLPFAATNDLLLPFSRGQIYFSFGVCSLVDFSFYIFLWCNESGGGEEGAWVRGRGA